jgi:hypothetical protein
MKHDYEQLGDRRFQEFCQALLVAEFPNLACLPVGMPDGGRDAASYRRVSDGSASLVFQVKYVERPGFLDDATTWAESVIAGETEKVKVLASRGAQQYFLVTNAPGSSHPDVGSIDKVQAVLDSMLPIPAQCLWRDDLDRRLENRWSLKWSYPDLMTGVDLIRALVEGRISEDGARRSRSIRAFLAEQYRLDHEVKFKQAHVHNDLLNMFVDVPAEVLRTDRPELTPLRHRIAVRSELTDGRRKRHPAVGAGTLFLDDWVQANCRGLVLEGKPGQGKSTLLQYVCQVHRMRLLDKRHDLNRLLDEHRLSPLRVPLKVDLRELAQWLEGVSPFAKDGPPPPEELRTLEGFLSALITRRSGGATFSVSDLHAVLETGPALLALDGLDEVVDVGDRGTIVQEIVAGVNRLSGVTNALQVIITTRPAWFATRERLPTPAFEYLTLTDIDEDLIAVYRDRWMDARELEAHERDELVSILDAKISQPHFRDLCRNPMQLAILLSLIHRKGPALPDRRADLYESYMEQFLDRETAKSLAVRDHRSLLLMLHGFIAWKLHVEAERSTQGAGRIAAADLVALAEDFLESRGHPRDLFEDLFTRAFDRFGALVARAGDLFEFEVQPLREFFAASYLYKTAPYSRPGRPRKGTQPERLDAMIRRPFWLNVARFYAGFYNVGELPSLVDRLESLANTAEFGPTALPRTVTAQFLADWTLEQDLRSQTRAVTVLTEGLGRRHVATAEDGNAYDGYARVFVLPPRAGGLQLAESGFRLLETDDSVWSRAAGIARAIRGNGDIATLKGRWIKGWKQFASTAPARWLELGNYLDVIAELSLLDLEEMSVAGYVDSSCLRWLISGGAFDFIDDTPERISAAIDIVLSGGGVKASNDGRSHPLEALAYVLHMDYAALVRESPYFGGPDEWVSPRGGPEDYADVVELTLLYDSLQAEPDVAWLNSLDPWDRIVEEGRRLFGERDGFDRLAIVSSGVRDHRDRGGGYGDFSDSNLSLVRRARHARFRSRDSHYWRRVLSVGGSNRDTMRALSLFCAWAAPSVIRECVDAAEDRISELSSDEYGFVAAAVSLTLRLADFSGKDLNARTRLTGLGPFRPSAGLFALLCPRLADSERVRLYRAAKFSGEYGDTNVLAWLLSTESDEGPKTDWRRLEDLMRQAARLKREPFGSYSHRGTRLPTAIAESIVRDGSNFPIDAIVLAEGQLLLDGVAATPTVGEVAERDEWFLPDGD